MEYFIEHEFENWNLAEARDYIFFENEIEEADINRKISNALKLIINSYNLFPLCRQRAKDLLNQFKDEGNSKDTGKGKVHKSAQNSPEINPKSYLNGGEGSVNINAFTNNWVVDNKNISEIFHRYRTKSIEYIENNSSPVNVYMELAINGIFFVSDEVIIDYNISEETFKKIEEETIKDYKITSNTTKITEEINYISMLCKSNIKKAIYRCFRWNLETIHEKSNNGEKEAAYSTLMTITNIGNKNMIKLKDSLFSSMLVQPILCPFLSQFEHIVLKGRTDPLGSGERNHVHLSLRIEVPEHDYALFLCEIKTDQYTVPENSLSDPSFIKLINLMKDELDRLFNVNAKNNVVYSALIKDEKCSIFALDFKYHKLYRLIKLGQFHFPVDKYDIQRLNGCFETLMPLKALIDASIEKFNNFYFNLNSPSTPLPTPILRTESLKSFRYLKEDN